MPGLVKPAIHACHLHMKFITTIKPVGDSWFNWAVASRALFQIDFPLKFSILNYYLCTGIRTEALQSGAPCISPWANLIAVGTASRTLYIHVRLSFILHHTSKILFTRWRFGEILAFLLLLFSTNVTNFLAVHREKNTIGVEIYTLMQCNVSFNHKI